MNDVVVKQGKDKVEWVVNDDNIHAVIAVLNVIGEKTEKSSKKPSILKTIKAHFDKKKKIVNNMRSTGAI